MAYGDNRTTVETDTFDSSIDSEWTNGPDLWSTQTWVTGGVVEPSSGGASCMITRNDAAHANDQYAIMTISAFGTNSEMGIQLRGGTTITRCYVAYCDSINPNRYQMIDVAEDGGSTSLMSDSGFGGSLSSGDTVTFEAEGSTLRMGTNEGSGDTQRGSDQTDSTWSDGEPGAFCLESSTPANSRYTAWEGGDIGAAAAATKFLTLLGVG
jgi:hypothetical protein